MEAMNLPWIAAAMRGTLHGDPSGEITAVTTDSRKITEGCLYIPLKGARFDGHVFIKEAYAQGAAAVVSSESVSEPEGRCVISVKDTLEALGDLAAAYRRSLSELRVVAVTGSVGKTSTKDFLHAVLSVEGSCLKTDGNFNNEIGLPLTVFRLDNTHRMAVLEMGMNHEGEIRRLSRIAAPDIAVITNIGVAHIENLGCQENILKAKMEVTEGMSSGSTLVINQDDRFLADAPVPEGVRRLSYGFSAEADVRGEIMESRGVEGSRVSVSYHSEQAEVWVPLPGAHAVLNALAALAAGVACGMTLQTGASGLGAFEASRMRMDIGTFGGVLLINDAYNASPTSMEAAIRVLGGSGAQRTAAVLGDMLELGSYAVKGHQDCGRVAAETGIDMLYATGEHAEDYKAGAMAAGMEESRIAVAPREELLRLLRDWMKPGDAVLVKGSRGSRMEYYADEIKNTSVTGEK